MIEKYKPSNGRYWLTGIVCMLYALNGPLYRWQDLITFVVVGAAAFFIGGKIFKGKKYYVPAESVQPEKKPSPKRSRSRKRSRRKRSPPAIPRWTSALRKATNICMSCAT